MKKSFTLFFSILILSCGNKDKAKQEFNVEIELAGISSTREAFQNAIKEKKYERIGNLVTEDVLVISPGSDDWNSMYKMYPERGPFPYDSIIMNPSETIIVNDSTAYDFGVSRVFYTDTIGKIVELKDTFLVILKKGKDNIWRLHREVASSNVQQ